jgi:uncharacterized protein (TIGR01777 family)
MNVLIAGGTGFIGSALMRSLIADKHRVFILTRNPLAAHIPIEAKAIEWDGHTCEGWLDVFEDVDAVVNLVGATIGQPFWTESRKKILVNSRVDAGLALSQAFQKVVKKPSVLVQASGVGFYGAHGPEPLNEETPPGNDFLASLAVQWESSTKVVDSLGVRRVIIRSGIVLGNKGILPLMSLPVRMCAGGPVGNGKQGVSWIHINDEVLAIRFLLENEKTYGPYNLTAPNPLSNADYMRFMAKALRRPYWLRAPAFAFRLLGEMSTLFLDGQFAIPQRLINQGFHFDFQSAFDAFKDLIS